jgi:hypothetical protein
MNDPLLHHPVVVLLVLFAGLVLFAAFLMSEDATESQFSCVVVFTRWASFFGEFSSCLLVKQLSYPANSLSLRFCSTTLIVHSIVEGQTHVRWLSLAGLAGRQGGTALREAGGAQRSGAWILLVITR